MGDNMDLDYDIDALKEGIEKAKKNIKVFEQAIDGENKTIKDYRNMIAVLEDKKDRMTT